MARVLGTFCHLERGMERGPCRDSHQDALLFRDPPGCSACVLVGDLEHLVDQLSLQDIRHEACADALNLVRPGLAATQHRGVYWFDSNGFEAWLATLDHVGHAGDGAAGADAGDEHVDLSVRVVPDFLGGRPAVHLRVGGIGELLQEQVALLLGELPCLVDGGAHPALARGQDELGAKSGEHPAPFEAHRFRHRQDEPVAPRGCDERQSDARVATGGLDEGHARLQHAITLGGLDHGEPDAVLDAGAGVEALELGDDLGVQAGGDARHPHERRATNEPGDVLSDGDHGCLLRMIRCDSSVHRGLLTSPRLGAQGV